MTRRRLRGYAEAAADAGLDWAAGLSTIAQSLGDQGELCARTVVEPGTTAPEPPGS